jgi:cobalt/nickel transport system ATP-binding protein
MIRARGLHYSFPGGIPALCGVDFDVPAQGRMALLGANGAGKTTLLLHLNGSLRPERGSICIDGETFGYDRRSLTRWRSLVGLVLQDPDDQLFAGTVYQDVSFGPLNLGLPEADVRVRVEAALQAMRIEHLADRPVHMLSFGQKRRAAIAGLVAMRPRVLLLDEPTAGLDPLGVTHLLAALRGLAEIGAVVVFATHDVDLAYGWADAIALIDGGRVIVAGQPEHVLADPELLRKTGLRMPLVLEVALGVRAAGLVAADRPLPRRPKELATWLQGGDPPSAGTAAARHTRAATSSDRRERGKQHS